VVVEGLLREQRPLHEVHEVGADVVEALALLVRVEEPGGRMLGAPATTFMRWCTLSM
jgi:hypothetical protein